MDNFDPNKPIPLNDIETGNNGVSHSPLDLGGSRPVEVRKTQKPQAASVSSPAANVGSNPVSMGKIIGVKTFFTKLHPGALDFLDDQINDWIKKNPDKDIKMIQTAVGDVQSKKTEPNIIITVWY